MLSQAGWDVNLFVAELHSLMGDWAWTTWMQSERIDFRNDNSK
jgi:hypothetical protein